MLLEEKLKKWQPCENLGYQSIWDSPPGYHDHFRPIQQVVDIF